MHKALGMCRATVLTMRCTARVKAQCCGYMHCTARDPNNGGLVGDKWAVRPPKVLGLTIDLRPERPTGISLWFHGGDVQCRRR